MKELDQKTSLRLSACWGGISVILLAMGQTSFGASLNRGATEAQGAEFEVSVSVSAEGGGFTGGLVAPAQTGFEWGTGGPGAGKEAVFRIGGEEPAVGRGNVPDASSVRVGRVGSESVSGLIANGSGPSVLAVQGIGTLPVATPPDGLPGENSVREELPVYCGPARNVTVGLSAASLLGGIGLLNVFRRRHHFFPRNRPAGLL